MLNSKYFGPMFFFLCFTLVALGAGLRVPQTTSNKPNRPQRPDFEHFPIVNFDAPEASDLETRSARRAKGRKYSKRYLPKISEDTDQLYSTADWDRGLPAIPSDKSSAIVIGTVTKSKAYLTEDQTAIYSEFMVSVDTVVKNDLGNPIGNGRSITVERNGGRVRMPSGKIVVSWTSHQKMPHVGSRYVLFLTHDFETNGDTGKDFYLLTGYLIQGGRVFPLDDTASGRAYTDVTESSFLNDLLSSV